MAGYETSIEVATNAAERAADAFGLPQTVYKDADSAGYWHTNTVAKRLANAEVVVTILPFNFFSNWS